MANTEGMKRTFQFQVHLLVQVHPHVHQACKAVTCKNFKKGVDGALV